jgi:YggT family protein
MVRLLLFIGYLLNLYIYVLIATAVMSWLLAFDVVNQRNNVVKMIWQVLQSLTEPVVAPIRRRMPYMGGIDLSFIVVFLIILFINSVLIPQLIDVLH